MAPGGIITCDIVVIVGVLGVKIIVAGGRSRSRSRGSGVDVIVLIIVIVIVIMVS